MNYNYNSDYDSCEINNYGIPEVNADDIISQLFYGPPKDSKSIQLIFENKDDGIVNYKDIFDLLIKTFVTGMIIKFGSNDATVPLHNINDINVNIINKYLNSIGFNVYYKIEKYLSDDDIYSYVENNNLPDIENDTDINNTYNNTENLNNIKTENNANAEKLEDYYIKLTSKENDKYYIWFSIY